MPLSRIDSKLDMRLQSKELGVVELELTHEERRGFATEPAPGGRRPPPTYPSEQTQQSETGFPHIRGFFPYLREIRKSLLQV